MIIIFVYLFKVHTKFTRSNKYRSRGNNGITTSPKTNLTSTPVTEEPRKCSKKLLLRVIPSCMSKSKAHLTSQHGNPGMSSGGKHTVSSSRKQSSFYSILKIFQCTCKELQPEMVDEYSRIIFPIAFSSFNTIYWWVFFQSSR